MKQGLRAIVAAFALAGCASYAPLTADDYDPGTTPKAQFLSNAHMCEKEAEADHKKFGMGPMDPYNGTLNRMYDACMRSSGYTRKPKKE
jgi:hypothetical protein